MARTEFANSPLITPERLKADRAEALSVLPSWLHACGLADPDLPLEDDAATLYVGKTALVGITLSPIVAAAVFELTRFGNSVATNGNGGPDEDMHVRLTLAGNAKDNQTIQRLVMNVGLHRRVELGVDRSDLRAENLSTVGDGKSRKDARETAIKHAIELARRAEADVVAYEANLRALFELHDELHLGTYDY